MVRPPKTPDYFDDIAVKQWRAKSRQLAERGDLTPADWNNLELYCVNYSIYRKAVEDLARRGFTVEGSRGAATSNPALKAKSDAEKVMIKISSLLGFDPVGRRRNPPETEEEDELDRLE
ncbi:phage terminase small subunit P27 family [Salmonella enterica subsp. enterica serovar Muenchen]|nr:phage terminase small subunit P27 family [Salmonella enterica subsp. enterica serovar Muenchen]